METEYNYEKALENSQKVNWQVDDLIGSEHPLDFSKRFLPESLAGVDALEFLSPEEKRLLNQIRGHEYLNIFALVEEFIVPFVVERARPHLHGEEVRVRALLTFAEEEVKHIALFKRFREEWEKGFGCPAEVIGPPEEIAEAVLDHDTLSVALAILHIEWMTQRHYTESAKADESLDPQFKAMLRAHWMEESQHTKLDTLEIKDLSKTYTEEGILRAVEGYLDIGTLIDEGLALQVDLNRAALLRKTRRTLDPSEAERLRVLQRKVSRWTYLGSGMTHPKFLATLDKLSPAARARVEDVSPAFC